MPRHKRAVITTLERDRIRVLLRRTQTFVEYFGWLATLFSQPMNDITKANLVINKIITVTLRGETNCSFGVMNG